MHRSNMSILRIKLISGFWACLAIFPQPSEFCIQTCMKRKIYYWFSFIIKNTGSGSDYFISISLTWVIGLSYHCFLTIGIIISFYFIYFFNFYNHWIIISWKAARVIYKMNYIMLYSNGYTLPRIALWVRTRGGKIKEKKKCNKKWSSIKTILFLHSFVMLF